MAELSLYLTESDELPIVALAIQLGCALIPDVNYPTAGYDSLTNIKEYKLYRPRTRLFYFLSEQFYRSPLEMRRIKKESETFYYIGNKGGPRIQFIGGGLFGEAESSLIRPRSIGHQAAYWSSLDQSMEKPPLELVQTYKALQKLIRSSFRHSKPGKVSFWIGPEAVEAVRSGAKLVGHEKYSAQQLLE